MIKINAANERTKHDYFIYLREAYGRDEATIDGVAKSLAVPVHVNSSGFTASKP